MSVGRSSLELLDLHVRALFELDADRRLIRVNEPNGGPAPRVFLGRTAVGNAWWFRRDLPEALAAELDAVCRTEPPGASPRPVCADEIESLLADHEPVTSVWSGPAFFAPGRLPVDAGARRLTEDDADTLQGELRGWRADLLAGAPLFAWVEAGLARSVCCSVRVTPAAHEAGVETTTAERGKGLGKRVVAAWAGAIDDLGAVPLYSTSWSNEASRGLARGLGLVAFATDYHVT